MPSPTIKTFLPTTLAVRAARKSLQAVATCAPVIFLILFAMPSQASDRWPEGIDRVVEQQTQSLNAMVRHYSRATADEKSRLLEEMTAVALDRKQILTQQVEENPGLLLRVALPAHLRDRMPIELQDFIEQRLEIQGKLIVFYEDHEGGPRLRYELETVDDRLPLHFKALPPKLLSGTRVRVTGRVQTYRGALELVPSLPYDVDVLK